MTKKSVPTFNPLLVQSEDLRRQATICNQSLMTMGPAPTPAPTPAPSLSSTTTTQAYGEAWYWENRYANESGPFDWYQNYSSLSPIINLYISHRHSRILVVGCGNSAFSESMADDGYEDVVSVDISSVVIQAMHKKNSNRPQLKYLQMDVRDMSAFDSASFDVVVDKGTLDSLLCGSNSRQMASKMLKEVGRVLKDKGVYILITYGAPVYRLRLLKEMLPWTIQLHVIEKNATEGKSEQAIWELTKPVPFGDDGNSIETLIGETPEVHYIYICTKEESLSSGV